MLGTHTKSHLSIYPTHLHTPTPRNTNPPYLSEESQVLKMGNYKFRFSDMMPNAWFYKLKDMNYRHKNHHKTSKPTNKKHTPSSFSSSSPSSSSVAATLNHPDKPHQSDQRKSYYFSRNLSFHPNSPTIEPPRKSSRRRRSTKRNRRPPQRIVSSSISAGCSCRATVEEEYANSPLDQTSSSDHESVLTEYGSDRGLTPDTFDGMLSWSIPCKCRTENEIVIDLDDNKPFNGACFNGDHLPPIITKKHEPTKVQRTSAEFSETNKYGSLSVKVVKEDFLIKDQHKTITPTPVRRFSVNSSSPGVKLRTNSPRIGNRRIQSGRKSVSSTRSRRSVSESFAVVKSSKDPHRDFRESMVEMIVENNIRASKDLEELLACYLALNSDEYHDLIINVFKQIWFDFIHVRLK